MATFTVKKDGSGTHATIQAAIFAASAGDTVEIGAGTFQENLDLYKGVILLGAGKSETIIEGSVKTSVVKGGTWALNSTTLNFPSGTTGFEVGRVISGTGIPANTRIVSVSANSVTISAPTTSARTSLTNATMAQVIDATIRVRGVGAQIKNLKVIGIDSSNPATEVAGIYLRNTGLGSPAASQFVIDNCEVVAVGDYALLADNAAGVTGGTITNTVFSGKTFVGDNPASGDQFAVFNVPRQLVVLQSANGSMVFTNNTISGITGGMTTAGTQSYNTACTIDAPGSTVTGNTIQGLYGYGYALRCRGYNMTIAGNEVKSVEGQYTSSGFYILPNYFTGITYNVDDVIFNSSKYWKCIQSHTSAATNSPTSASSAQYWLEMTLADVNALPNVGVGKTTIGTNLTVQPSLVTIVQSGSAPEATFKKAELMAIGKVANDAYFANEANWKLVSFVFKKLNSAKRLVSVFRDFSLSRLMKLKAGMASGDQFELQKVILSDAQRNLLVVNRDDISSAESYDFTLNSTYQDFLTLTIPDNGVTLNGLPVISGRTTSKATVTVSTGDKSAEVTANTAGLYTFQVPESWNLSNSTHVFTVSGFNGTIQKTVSVTLDIGTVTENLIIVSPTPNQVLQTLTPVISGTTGPGKTVSFSDGARTGTVTAAEVTGDFSFTVPAEWAYADQEGHQVTVSINDGSVFKLVDFTIDLPDVVNITSHQAAEVITTTTPTISGATTKNVVVTIFDGAMSGTVTSSATGYFSFDVPTLWGWADGQTKTVTATTPDGHSAQVILTITLPPTITISSPSDGATVQTLSPTIYGSTKANTSVSLSDGTNSGTVISDGSGVWSFSTASWGFSYGQTKTITASLSTGQSAQVSMTMPAFAWTSATKLADPDGMGVTYGQTVKFSPSNNLMMVGLGRTSPYAETYEKQGENFVKISNPPNLNRVLDIDFSKDGSLLAMGSKVYRVNGTTFNLIGSTVNTMDAGGRLAFSDSAQYLATAWLGTKHKVYKIVGDTLVDLNAPFKDNNSYWVGGIKWSHNDRFLYVSDSNGSSSSLSGGFRVYERNGDTFTQIASSLINGKAAFSMAISPDGNLMVFGCRSNISRFEKTGDTTWTQLSQVNTSPATGDVFGLSFSPDGKYLLASHNGSSSNSYKGATLFAVNGTALSVVSGAFPEDVFHGSGCDWSNNGQYIAIAQGHEFGTGYKNAIVFKNGI